MSQCDKSGAFLDCLSRFTLSNCLHGVQLMYKASVKQIAVKYVQRIERLERGFLSAS